MNRFLVFSTLLACSLRAAEPVPLTLEQAIAAGLERNHVLRVAQFRTEAAAARADETSTSLLPGLRLAGNYTKLSPGEFILSTPSVPALPVAPVVDNTFAFRVGIQQPLFTGYRLTGLADVAKAQSQASVLDLAMSRADLALTVASAYWTLYQAERLAALAGENVRRLASYRVDVGRLTETGLATRNDLLKIEVQLAGARLAQIDAENDRQLAAMTLNNVMGEPLGLAVLPISDPLATAHDTLLALAADGNDSTLAELAAGERADLIAAQWMTEAARAGVTAARGSWWPQIDLTANYYYSQPNSRYQPVTPEFLGSWDVGVHLAMDLWNWGRTGYTVEQAEAALKQSEHQHAQARENVNLEVRRAGLAVRRSRDKLDVARLGVEQAQENLRMTEEKFRTGLVTSSELLDAQVALAQAETSLAVASVEVALAGAKLSRAVGRERP